MASVYEKPNWSSDMEQIKVVAERLGHGSVGIMARVWKLMKYCQEDENFSLTDIWAALVVPTLVKKVGKQ